MKVSGYVRTILLKLCAIYVLLVVLAIMAPWIVMWWILFALIWRRRPPSMRYLHWHMLKNGPSRALPEARLVQGRRWHHVR